jgi:wobble nucleotide-excising tRNase
MNVSIASIGMIPNARDPGPSKIVVLVRTKDRTHKLVDASIVDTNDWIAELSEAVDEQIARFSEEAKKCY